MRNSVATTVRRKGLEWRPDTGGQAIERVTPAEVAIGLSFNGRPHTVLMATPEDIEDLAVGFAVTEGVAAAAEIIEVRIERRAEGVLTDLAAGAHSIGAARTPEDAGGAVQLRALRRAAPGRRHSAAAVRDL